MTAVVDRPAAGALRPAARPRAVVVTVALCIIAAASFLLSMVLDHLESGRLIQPILPDDAPASWDEEWDEDQSAKAGALIEMIQETCPETLRAVRDFRTQESAQAEIDNMIYSKQPGMASIQSRG